MNYTYAVVIEQDEDGMYIAKVPDIAGCHTQAKTIPELMTRITEAIQLCVAEYKDNIIPLNFIGLQQVTITA